MTSDETAGGNQPPAATDPARRQKVARLAVGVFLIRLLILLPLFAKVVQLLIASNALPQCT